MVIFHSYVSLPEGNSQDNNLVGGGYLPLWKMMEWKSVGMIIPFHSQVFLESHKKKSSSHQPELNLSLPKNPPRFNTPHFLVKVHLNSDPMLHSAWCFSPLQMVTGWSTKNPLLGWTHRAKKVSQLVVKTWWKVHEKLGSSALVAASVLPNAVLPATSAAHSSDLLAHSPRPRCEREKPNSWCPKMWYPSIGTQPASNVSSNLLTNIITIH